MNIPKMPCAILKCWQTPMLGMDIHDNFLPPAIPAPVPIPYYVFTVLPAPFLPSAKYTFSVLSSGNGVILRGSDSGSFTPHIGNIANILYPIILATSASKTEFGVFSVKMENQPVAAAFPLVFATLNTNCAGPSTKIFPSVTNIVIAPNTHFVGMGIGDIIASALSMALDMLIQAAINWGCGKIGGYIANNLLPAMLMESMLQGVATKEFVGAIVNQRSATAIGNFIGFILGDFVTGSPLGYSGAMPFSDTDATALGNVAPYQDSATSKYVAGPLNNFFNGESL